jgi:protease-4
VALVSLDGVIAADAPANANTVVAGLRDAFADGSSKAVILSINSPGGSPVQSGYINDEIYRLKALYPEKKLYAVIADLGASGGYYVASAADEIYADKASLVGSIGVISAGFGFEKLIEKMGVERRIYSAGESKAFLDSFSAEKERDVTFWQSVLAETHAQFIEVVKAGRGERLINDPAIFSGLIWTGEGALAKGLIDGLGSAGYVAREVIGVEDVIDYTVEPNPFEQFAKRIGTYFALGVRSMMAPQLR